MWKVNFYEDIVGHYPVVRYLSELSKVGVHQDILLHGPDGIGKKTLSLLYVQSLEGEVCYLPDIVMSHIERDLSEEKKSLVITTDDIGEIPASIKTRCQVFEMKSLTIEESINFLNRAAQTINIVCEDQALSILAYMAKGKPHSLLSFLDQVSSLEEVTVDSVKTVLGLMYLDKLVNYFQALCDTDLLKLRESIVEWNDEPENIIRYITEFALYLYYRSEGVSVMVHPAFAGLDKGKVREVFESLEVVVGAQSLSTVLQDILLYFNRMQVKSRTSLEVVSLVFHTYIHNLGHVKSVGAIPDIITRGKRAKTGNRKERPDMNLSLRKEVLQERVGMVEIEPEEPNIIEGGTPNEESYSPSDIISVGFEDL